MFLTKFFVYLEILCTLRCCVLKKDVVYSISKSCVFEQKMLCISLRPKHVVYSTTGCYRTSCTTDIEDRGIEAWRHRGTVLF